ncbi:hypothetical protein HC766_06080, partial [Candidatus Gracilibacteria bacterium]|nr:hypothetical protein [Candidatus Gracilibacteria bacterium]
MINLFPCNASDTDQIWRKTYITGNPNYVQPLSNGSVGILESQAGKRISLPNLANGGAIQGRTPNNNDASQRIKFNWNGYAYTLYRDQTTYGLSSTGLDYIGLGGNAMNIHAYTNASGRYGSFGFVDLGGGYFQVKSFFYPKYCLSTSSGALTVLFTC